MLFLFAFLEIYGGGSLSWTCVKELKKLEKRSVACGKLEKFGIGVLGIFGCSIFELGYGLYGMIEYENTKKYFI